MYGAYRPAEDGSIYWRIAHFLFPFYTMIPTGVLGLEVRGARLGADGRRPHALAWACTRWPACDDAGREQRAIPSTRPSCCRTPPTGTAASARGQRAQRLPDRPRQAAPVESYTGMPSVTLEDQAVTESMGAIYDRTQEHLGTSDTMIIRTRRRLIDAAKALRDNGVLPPGVDDPKAYAVRSGGVMLPKGVDWLEGSAELRRGFVDHPELSRQVLGGIPAV